MSTEMTVDLRVGHSLEVLRTLPDGCVHCCVTSPPYWGLRDYGTATWEGGDPACDHKQGRNGSGRADGIVDDRGQRNRDGVGSMGGDCRKCGARRIDQQLGLEPTVEAYVARLVEVFREVRRVLRDDGTLWLNMGDSYASGKGTCHNPGGGPKSYVQEKERYPLDRGSIVTLRKNGLKPKDLVGVPWRVAFALQADGWWLRSDIIWAKRAPMPESVTDRPTRSHEYIFLLSKSARYYYDAEAVREPYNPNSIGRYNSPLMGVVANARKPGGDVSRREREKGMRDPNPSGRNQRDVWLLSPEPYSEAHFATFVTEIPRRAILAGTSARGVCAKCGAPWKRVVENRFVKHPNGLGNGTETKDLQIHQRGSTSSFRTGGSQVATTTSWRPTCTCNAGDSIPATVLDPFAGSGTTGAVAVGLGRSAILIELNPAYAELARKRIQQAQRPLPLSGVAS